MIGKTRLSMIVMTFLLVLALSAMWTVPARADDGTPQPPDVPAVSQGTSDAPAAQDAPAAAPPAQKDAPAKAPVVETKPKDPVPTEAPAVATQPTDPAPTESPVVETQPTNPAPTESPVVETQPTNPAPTEAATVETPPTEPASVDTGSTQTSTDAPASPTDLSQVPTGTDVKVLDATGAVVPLASTEAAQIVSNGDPMWCPTGVTPGNVLCTSAQSSFAALLPLIVNKSGAGTIWIASSYVGTSGLEGATVTLDGASLLTPANFALTLKGGWSGLTGSTATDPLHPSTFNIPLVITGWKADVTLSDILITGVPGASSTALTVNTTKNINLTRVNVNDNAGAGAHLNNSGGTGSVVVTSSQFNRNHGTTDYTGGLVIDSKGAITLNSVTANDNGAEGALIGSYASPTGNVVVTSSQFNNNLGSTDNGGLYISSKGAITLNSVTANGNYDAGAYLINNFTGSTAGITLTGTNVFNNNGWNGLIEFSYGPIAANNVTANNNGLLGANLSNMWAATPQPLTLTGINNFNTNWSDGLDVFSKGIITLNNLTANGNGFTHPIPGSNVDGDGVYVDNTVNPAAPQDVIINGTNSFTGNSLHGLEIYSYGAITLNNATVSNNGQGHFAGYGKGAILDNCQWNSGTSKCGTLTPKPINLTGANIFSNNYEQGLLAQSKGLITSSNLTANNNGGDYGAMLYNYLTGATAGITMTGTNTFNGNNGTGLNLYSYGAITVNNITANSNVTGWGAYISNNGATTPANITLTGTNAFNGNYLTGLVIYSKGAITANNVTASGNGSPSSVGAYGAYLSNWGAATPLPLTLTGTNIFNLNYGDGIDVYSRGVITLNNLTANDNGLGHVDPATNRYGIGVLVDNSANSALPQNVIINGTNTFNNNWLSGMEVYSFGNLTLNNLNATSNGLGNYSNYGYGVYLDNCLVNSGLCRTITPKFVTLTGTNTFTGNYESGLDIQSKGVITTNNLTAINNATGWGALLENEYTGATGGVTVSGINSFAGNWYDGLSVSSYGAIALNNITATGNGLSGDPDVYGIYADNSTASTPQPFSLTGTNSLNGNYAGGLFVTSKGAITVNNLTANGNTHGSGAELNNTFTTAAAPQNVTLTGVNNLSGNHVSGLVVNSKGAITINGLVANSNTTGYGAQLNNKYTGVSQLVTVNGGTFNLNALNGTVNGLTVSGLDIQSNVAVKLNSLPMWCPTGILPGGIGCSASFTNLQDLVDHVGLGFNPNLNGVIWIQNATFEPVGSAIVFNGNLNGGLPGPWTTWSGFSLTLQGGWIGPGATIASNTLTTLKDPLSILNWKADVTLNDIIITGLTGAGSTALKITTTKNITLTRVNVHDNAGGGAILDNSAGTGNVTVTSGNFNKNAGTPAGYGGLGVRSKGAITLNSVTANFNAGTGAILENTYYVGLTPPSVTITGTNAFNNNTLWGLSVGSNGAITLNNVTASLNSGPGAGLINDTGTSGVTLTGSNAFSGNTGGAGLFISSKGAINLNNISAISNSGPGASIDNHTATSAQAVILTGNNAFSGNSSSGLTVYSKGVITLNNITANDNGSNGAYLDNQWSGAIGGINVNGTSEFARNIGTGLEAFSNGSIVVANLDAYENHNDGVYLDNDVSGATGSVSVGTTLAGWYNALESNSNNGLVIFSRGAITLLNVGANGNSATGAILDNSDAISAMPVTLSTVGNEFNHNTENGLSIYSKGLITLKDIDVIGNGCSVPNSPSCFTGAYLDNTFGTAGITMTGTNVIAENHYGGLAAFSHGAVAINNLIANFNGAGAGAYIDNCDWNGANCINTVAAPVTFSGTNEFKSNTVGLQVYSNGAISLNNVTASNNNGLGTEDGGAYLRNNFAFTSNMTLTGTNTFENNGRTGLTVLSKGAIALSNVSANGNGHGEDPSAIPPILPFGYGALLDNTYATTPQAVTLNVSATNPDNVFKNNFSGGLVINSKGALNLSGVAAENNTNGNGATLKNDYPGAVGGITIGGWGGNFQHNSGYGLNATSLGAITASNLWAWDNSSYGAFLDNSAGTGAVTISVDTSYGNNGSFGLMVHSKGAITLGTISTNANGGMGVILDNTYSGVVMPQAITLNGANHDFNNNIGDGLSVRSYGAITISNLNASNNGGNGVTLDNCIQSGPGVCTASISTSATLNGYNNFERNSGDGLDITSKGLITTNNVSARDNHGTGAYLDNQMTGALGAINVNNTPTQGPEFARNGLDGLDIFSNGNITVMDLNAYQNGQLGSYPDWGYGIYLDNASGGGSGNISLGTSRANWQNGFDNNFLSGLEVYSNGTVTLSNIEASNNGGDNGVDPVYGYGALVDNQGFLKVDK